MTTELLPAPDLSPDAGPYWDAAKENQFLMQNCDDCGEWRFVPSHLCTHCGSDKTSWKEPSGKGVIYSLTTVHRGPTAAFREHTPYVIVFVDLPEGPRIMTNLVGDNIQTAAIGDAVQICFEERQGGAKVPQFRLVKDGGAS